jgi:glucans biosynthesis protein
MLASSLALMATTSLTRPGFAQDGVQDAQPAPFSYDILTDRMKDKATRLYEAPPENLPDYLQNLDYDQYRSIRFKTDRAKWPDSDLFRIQAFHLGWLSREALIMHEITNGMAKPMQFSAADFSYPTDELTQQMTDGPWPGIAGFRIHSPINTKTVFDELVAFQGASYFRALGRGNNYGLSARGIVIDSWVEGPEEFPRFSEFYMEHPAPGQPLAIYAALEGPSVTGAYRFIITPANADVQETVMEVTARLFFRADVLELGIAPLTSMFLYADNNRSQFDDYRPQVHDSNGLIIEKKTGEVIWRALNNPPSLANSYFGESDLAGFGLYQRNRSFDDYQDAEAHYERRPSLRVEPIGDWGQGSVRLIEVPAKLEADDNIGAFWVPAEPIKAGDMREFSYRLRWGDLNPGSASGLAYVADTRGGQGGVSGVANNATLRKFVIDFKGGPLETLDPATPPDIATTITGGTLKVSTVSKIETNGIWRLVLDVEIAGDNPVELQAFLSDKGRQLTETWLYQWRAAA